MDRLVATLIHLRHDLPHAVLAVLFGVDRSTLTRSIDEVHGLPAGGVLFPTVPACGCERWRTCSPTPRPRVSS